MPSVGLWGSPWRHVLLCRMQELRLLCLVVLVGLARRACPEPCECGEKYGFHIADCAYRDLKAVPSRLPGQNVTTLSLSANQLSSLPGAFREVPRLQSLWLALARSLGVTRVPGISEPTQEPGSQPQSSLTLPGATCTASAPFSCSRWTTAG